MNKIEKFLFKNGQSIWDNYEYLTALELIRELIKKMNEVIDETNTLEEIVIALRNWFDTLDVQDEVNAKLDEMVTDGTLASIINVEIFGKLNTKIDDIALNIRDFESYVVDGDYTPALMAMENSMPPEGGTILIPYKITVKKPIIFNKKIRLLGIGKGYNRGVGSYGQSVIIKGGNFDTITFRGHDSSMENIQIAGALYNGDGVVIQASRVKLKNVSVTENAYNGIRIGSDTGEYNCNLWVLEQVSSVGNKLNGLYIHNPYDVNKSNCNGGVLIGGDYRGNEMDGIRLQRVMNCFFYSPITQTNLGKQIRFMSGAKGNHLYGVYAEGHDNTGDILFEEGSRQNLSFGYRSELAYSGYKDDTTDKTNMILDYDTYGDFYFRNYLSTRILKIKNPEVTGRWTVDMLANRDLKIGLIGTGSSGYLDIPSFRINGGQIIKNILFKGQTLNFSSVPPQGTVIRNVTVAGIKQGDSVIGSPRETLPPGIVWNCYISGVDTITINVNNITSETVVVPEMAWAFEVIAR